jgi:hypothetical protein
MVFVGRTEEEGRTKYEDGRRLVSVEGGLARFSGLANVDMSVYPLDEVSLIVYFERTAMLIRFWDVAD